MGIAEIAELFGVSKQAVSMWWKRGQMPEPIAELRMGPVWTTTAILEHKERYDAISVAKQKAVEAATQMKMVRRSFYKRSQ